MDDIYFMKEALKLAESSLMRGDEPFGAVLVKDGEIVFRGENRINTESDPTYHAETGLIRDFIKETKISDLSEYTLYTTCEPCFMCAGTMVWAKLGRLIYGASNDDLRNIRGKKGFPCSKTVFENSSHSPVVISSVLREECVNILKNYFSKR